MVHISPSILLFSHLVSHPFFLSPPLSSSLLIFFPSLLDPKFYEEVKDLPKLTGVLNGILDNYNMIFPTQMNLVFFVDALSHAVRISRILRQPRGKDRHRRYKIFSCCVISRTPLSYPVLSCPILSYPVLFMICHCLRMLVLESYIYHES